MAFSPRALMDQAESRPVKPAFSKKAPKGAIPAVPVAMEDEDVPIPLPSRKALPEPDMDDDEAIQGYLAAIPPLPEGYLCRACETKRLAQNALMRKRRAGKKGIQE